MGLARKGLLLTANTYLVLALGLVQIAILSRALGPGGAGQMTLFRQTFLLFIEFASLGLPMAMVQKLRSNQIEPQVALPSVLLVTGFTALVSGAIAVIVLAFDIGGFFGPSDTGILVAAAIWIPCVLLRAVFYFSQVAELDVRSMMVQEALPPAMLGAWYLASWRLGWITVPSSILAEAVIMGALSLALAICLARPWRTMSLGSLARGPDWRFIKSIVWNGIQIESGTVLLLLNGYVSLTLLRICTGGFQEVGYFSRGLRLATITILGVQSVQRLLYANWAGLDAQRRARSVEKTLNFTLMVVVMVGAVVLLAAEPLTVVLFGREFLPAVSVTRITVAGVAMFLVVRVLQALFNADGRSRYNLWVLGLGLIANAAGTLALAPLWKADGASWATLISNLLMAAMALWFGCRKYGLRLRAMVIPQPSLLKQVAESVLLRQRNAAQPEGSPAPAQDEPTGQAEALR